MFDNFWCCRHAPAAAAALHHAAVVVRLGGQRGPHEDPAVPCARLSAAGVPLAEGRRTDDGLHQQPVLSHPEYATRGRRLVPVFGAQRCGHDIQRADRRAGGM